MTRVAVLLSTYNGQDYISQLLDSILAQTFTDFKLIVRDDGSTDQTTSILQHYAILSDKLVLTSDDLGRIGARNSFIHLLGSVDAEYYLFCDQDDVWLPNKILLLIASLETKECLHPGIPIVVHTDMIIVDKSLRIISPSMHAQLGLKHIDESFPIVNFVSGCSMAFNHRAKCLAMPFFNQVSFWHDHLITASVHSSNGSIVTIPLPTVLYRQHSHNAVGALQKRGGLVDCLNPSFLSTKAVSAHNLYNDLNILYGLGFAKYLIVRFLLKLNLPILGLFKVSNDNLYS
jgi:glycosyltransferase involved in cell wall biosynthesis